MGVFTSKGNIMPNNAMIGESLPNGDIEWCIADYDNAWAMYVVGILEDRGWKTINSIYYKLYYLPPIPNKCNTII